MEDRGSRCDEDLGFERGTHNVRVGPNETMITDHAAMPGCGSNNGVLHNDAIAPDPDRATILANDAGAIKNVRRGQLARFRKLSRPARLKRSGRCLGASLHVR